MCQAAQKAPSPPMPAVEQAKKPLRPLHFVAQHHGSFWEDQDNVGPWGRGLSFPNKMAAER